MLMVVVLHTWYNFVIRPDFFNTPIWWLLEPIVAVSKTSVLLFFILSGYLLLPKQETMLQNLKRTWSKLVIPLIVFGILYSYRFLTSLQLIEVTQLVFWHNILVNLLKFPNSPLWFLQVLIGLYLLNPVWRFLFSRSTRSLALSFVLISGLFSISIPLLEIIGEHQFHLLNSLTAWAGFAFFYLVGGLIKKGWIPQFRGTHLLSLEIGSILLIVLGDFLSLQSPNWLISGYTAEYLSLPVMLLAVSLFLHLLRFDLDALKLSQQWQSSLRYMSAWLASLSFGVYLIHPLVVDVLQHQFDWYFDHLQLNVYVFNFCNYVLVFGISACIVAGFHTLNLHFFDKRHTKDPV